MTSVTWTTSSGKYLVTDVNHFACIMAQGSGFSTTGAPSSYLTASFLQTANIDYSGYSSNLSGNSFAGTYDGGGYSISNVSVTASSGTWIGLFGNMSGTVQNANFTGSMTLALNSGQFNGLLSGSTGGT
ncbi:unnamed protein product, partial [Phaeothamnion confervicola]